MVFEKTLYVEESIGKGSFGNVYKIFDSQDMKHYALKTVPFKHWRTKLNEIRISAECNHFNIVRYFGNGLISSIGNLGNDDSQKGHQMSSSTDSTRSVEDTNAQTSSETESTTSDQQTNVPSSAAESSSCSQERTITNGSSIVFRNTTIIDTPIMNAKCFEGKYLCMQMELCLRETLKVWIDVHTKRRINQQAVLHIMSQLMSAVAYLHKNKIIHRDIKTENIFIQASDRITDDFITIKLGDFGLATKICVPVEGHSDSSALFSIGVGTPYYMAPEVKTGIYDYKADVYSCGIIFLDLLSQAKTRRELVHYLEHYQKNSRLESADRKFACYVDECKIIEKMIVTNPEDRYKSWKCLHAISRILSSQFQKNSSDSLNYDDTSSPFSSLETLDFKTPNWFNGIKRGVYLMYGGTYCSTREQLLPVILFEDKRSLTSYEIMKCKELQFFDYPTTVDNTESFFNGLGPKGNQCLQHLRFYNSEFLSDELVKKLFEHYEYLRTFSYFNKSEKSKGTLPLAYLARYSETLRHLTLRGISLISNVHSISSCRYTFPLLKTLALVDCEIDEFVVQNLNTIFPHLKRIVFFNNNEIVFKDGQVSYLAFVDDISLKEISKRKNMQTALINYYVRGATNDFCTMPRYEKFYKNEEGKIKSIPLTSPEFVEVVASIFKKNDIYTKLGL